MNSHLNTLPKFATKHRHRSGMAAVQSVLSVALSAIMLIGVSSYFDSEAGIRGGTQQAVARLFDAQSDWGTSSGGTGGADPIEIEPVPSPDSGPDHGNDANDPAPGEQEPTRPIRSTLGEERERAARQLSKIESEISKLERRLLRKKAALAVAKFPKPGVPPGAPSGAAGLRKDIRDIKTKLRNLRTDKQAMDRQIADLDDLIRERGEHAHRGDRKKYKCDSNGNCKPA